MGVRGLRRQAGAILQEMDRPWQAERTLSAHDARLVIENQFVDLVPACVELVGVGWDNSAFAVNDAWIFRFPRREIAVPLIRTEATVLPFIASCLPLAIPVPEYLGEPCPEFPWPFAGYRALPGRTACRAGLDDTQRREAVPALAGFLRALHDVSIDDAAAHGAAPDAIARLDYHRRGPRLLERLGKIEQLGMVADARPYERILEDLPTTWEPGAATLCHGDLYARHVLVDDAGVPCGVIDWGDVHLGNAAVDLAIAHAFFPPDVRDTFRRAYGAITQTQWRVARFRALHLALVILLYGLDTGDEALINEGRVALGFVATP